MSTPHRREVQLTLTSPIPTRVRIVHNSDDFVISKLARTLAKMSHDKILLWDNVKILRHSTVITLALKWLSMGSVRAVQHGWRILQWSKVPRRLTCRIGESSQAILVSLPFTISQRFPSYWLKQLSLRGEQNLVVQAVDPSIDVCHCERTLVLWFRKIYACRYCLFDATALKVQLFDNASVHYPIM